MRVTNSVVFGLVSLTCTVSAAKVTGKPVLANRQTLVTATQDGCTAVCVDLADVGLGKGTECDVYCSGGFSTRTTRTSTVTASLIVATSTEAALKPRTVGSHNDGACHETCSVNEAEGDFDCYFTCDAALSTLTSAKPSSTAALKPRTATSTSEGDCTLTCWGLQPGTECDLECSSDFEDEERASHKAVRVANMRARENVQARQVQEARLARKFGGVVARDDGTTVTVTSIPAYCTAGLPSILPAQIPQAALASDMSAVLSQASVAISAAEQAFPSAASSALSSASALLSSASAAPPISANATTVTSVLTGSAPTVSSTKSGKIPAPSTASKTTTESITSSETSTESTTSTETSTESTTSSETVAASTITGGTVFLPPLGPATSTPFTIGSATENSVSTGLILCLLIGLAANAAFLI